MDISHTGIAPRGQCSTPFAVRLLVRCVLRVQVIPCGSHTAVVRGRRSHEPNSHERVDNSTVTTVRHHVSDSPSRIRKPDAPPGCDVTVTFQECAECHDTHHTNRTDERFVCGSCGHLAHVGIVPRDQHPTPFAVRLLVRFVLRVQVNHHRFAYCKLRPTVR